MTNTATTNQQHFEASLFSHSLPAGESQGNPPSQTFASLRRLVRVLHRTLRDHEGNSSLIERFDELTKAIYCKIYDEKDSTLGARGAAFCIQPNDTDQSVAARIRGQFLDLVERRPELFPERFSRLHMQDFTIRRLVEDLSGHRLASVSDDLKGLLYEEIIRNTFDKGDNQQFFTPRPIVEFMVHGLESSLVGKICDPACGTGGFLLQVQKHLKQYGSIRDTALIGFEIDERLSWVAGVNLDMQDPGCPFAALHIDYSGSLGGSLKPYFNTIDTILTNPPFGSDLSEKDALRDFELGKGKASRRRGVLFIERCLDLLKPGGVVAIIIDDGVLNGPSNTDTRRLILDRSHPLAIVSLPDTAFMPYASVKSSILFLQKHRKDGTTTADDHLTFFAHAEVVGRRPNGDPLLRHNSASGQMELDSDLPAILGVWKQGPGKAPPEPGWSGRQSFWARIPSTEDISFATDTFRIDPTYHHPARRLADEALLMSRHPLRTLGELCELRNETLVPAKDRYEEEITYLGLAHIESYTGGYAPVSVSGSTLKSTVKRFVYGDILFAKMRPALKKVCLISDDIDEGFTSSECLVLTPRPDPTSGSPIMLSQLIAILLRSDLVYGQLMHLVTGIGRPRLNPTDVLNVRLPVPDSAEQHRLLDLYSRSDEAAQSLLEESARAARNAGQIMTKARQGLIDDILSPSEAELPMSIPTNLFDLLNGTSKNPERVLKYLTNHLLPQAVKILNEDMLPRVVPLFLDDTLPTNQRNLTDVRTRIGILLEYEFAKAVTASLPSAVREQDIELTYVIANQFPDLAFRAGDGRIGVRFEVKAIEAIAEEKSANFSTLIKDIRKNTDFVVILLWEWEEHGSHGKRFPCIDSFFVMDAYQLAQIRDCKWLSNPPSRLQSARQGFDLNFAVNASADSFNKEGGNFGKLMRIFDPQHEDLLPDATSLRQTLDTYYCFAQEAARLGLQHIGQRIAEAAATQENSRWCLVSDSLPVCFLVERDTSRLVVLGNRHKPRKHEVVEAMENQAAGAALLLNENFQWTVRNRNFERLQEGRKPESAIEWVTEQWEYLMSPHLS